MIKANPLFLPIGLGILTVALVAVPELLAGRSNPTAHAAEVQAPQDAVQGFNIVDDDNDVEVFVNPHSGWLGAGISEVTAGKVKQLKLPAERGVELEKIVPDGPAAKAGLKDGDVVTEINGQRVEGTEQFRRMIREIPPGRTAQFSVWRGSRAQTVSVTLGKSEMHQGSTFVTPVTPGSFAFQLPELPEIGDLFSNGPSISSRTRLGIDAENLSGELGNYFGAPDGEGVLVRRVLPDSPAAKAGLKAGDVITSVNGERVHTIGELRTKVAEKQQENTAKLGIIRNKAPLSLSVELPAPHENRKTLSGGQTGIA